MPMMRYEAKLAGGEGRGLRASPARSWTSWPTGWRTTASPARCATRSPDQNLGKRESFVGGFKIDEKTAPGERHVYRPVRDRQGPHDDHEIVVHVPADARASTSASSGAVRHLPHAADHRRWTPQGKVIGELPEQVPYQEWLHSDYKETRSCQSCHMPVVKEDVPITSVFGEPRAGFSRHTFVGRQFLHAADAEPLPQRPVRHGAAPGNGRRGEPHDRASAIGGGEGRDAEPAMSATAVWTPACRWRTWAATSCRPRIRRAACGCT